MKLTTRKKQAVLVGLVVLLGVAVMTNWYFTGPNAGISSTGGNEDSSNVDSQNLGDAIYVNSTEVDGEYFASAKLSRDESYDSAVATLKEIIESSDVDKQSLQTASDAMASITQRQIAQANIENLVRAKTGSECVAVISDDSVEIIISDSAVSASSILQIKEIVMNNTEISAEKISIIGTK